MTQGTQPRRQARRRSRGVALDKLLAAILAMIACVVTIVNLAALHHLDSSVVIGKDIVGTHAAVNRTSKERLIKILKYASVAEPERLRDQLPTWGEVMDRFGDKQHTYGLDTCEAYRKRVSIHRRLMAPAGTFNSGTNFLFDVLRNACKLPWQGPEKGNEGVFWQVNWGKHQPPRFRMEHHSRPQLINQDYLPIVMVRDPFSWMQSMCNVRYAAHWFHVVARSKNSTDDPAHCPNLIANDIDRKWLDTDPKELRQYYDRDPWKVDNIKDKANFTINATRVPVRVHYKTADLYHDTLLDMWVDWYGEYANATFPRLMVRLEDLVYHPHEVLTEICDCAGGTMNSKVRLTAKSVKMGADNVHGTDHTDLAKAMAKHARQNRTYGMTQDDLAYAKQLIMSSRGQQLMEAFGYTVPSDVLQA